MKDACRIRLIAKQRKIITILIAVIIVLLVFLADKAARSQALSKHKVYPVTRTCERGKGCEYRKTGYITIEGLDISINIKGDSLKVFQIEKRFLFKGSDHYRIHSGILSGFFIVHYAMDAKSEIVYADKAFIIYHGNKIGQHTSIWYTLKRLE